jgi:hypothetical protein
MSQLLHEQASQHSRASQDQYLPVTPYTTGLPDNRRSTKAAFGKASSFGSSSVRPMQHEQPSMHRSMENPLTGIISDELFNTLLANDLLNEKALRDFMIRQQFKKLKAESNMRTMEVMNEIQRMYPYLQLDTIRKIVYRVYPTSGKKPML